jgi:putative ABC transport system permease protein
LNEAAVRYMGLRDPVGQLARCFAVLAVFISCLGLFGMASFTAEQRVKEIGVRKVLGASVVRLWGLLSRELVGLSLLIVVTLATVSYQGIKAAMMNPVNSLRSE